MISRYSITLYLTTMGMEICCLYLGLVWVRQSFGLGYITMAVILAAHPVTLFLRLLASRRSSDQNRVTMAAVGLGAIAAVIIFALLAGAAHDTALGEDITSLGLTLQIGLLLTAGWLGFSLAGTPHGYRQTVRRFQGGVLALIIGSALNLQVVLVPVVVFLTLAVVTLALARWQHSLAASDAVLAPLPIRKIVLGCLALLIPVIALFFAMTPGVAQNIVDGLAGIGKQFNQAVTQTPKPESYDGSRWRLSCDCNMEAPEEEAFLPEEAAPSPPGEHRLMPQWLIWLSIALVFATMVLLAFRWRRHDTHPDVAAVQVTVGKVKVSLGQEFRSWLKSAGCWLWHLLRRLWSGFKAETTLTPPAEAGLTPVRQLYRYFLRWATERGLPRASRQTPLEFRAVLLREYPTAEIPLRRITDAYCRARYSQGPLRREDVDAAQEAWQEISSLPPKPPPDEP
jgi:uncharacterized protein DUF4129